MLQVDKQVFALKQILKDRNIQGVDWTERVRAFHRAKDKAGFLEDLRRESYGDNALEECA